MNNCCSGKTRIITRRKFLRESAGLFIAGSTNLPFVFAAAARVRKPNILFLMDDQHRADALGIDGNKVIKTPNLDWLASEGAYFHRAYSSLPSCLPARCSLLTGQSPWGHGLISFADIPEELPIEKPRLLHQAGYYTLGIGKMHYSPHRNTHGYHRTILEESWASLYEKDFKCDYAQWFNKVAPGLNINPTGLGSNDRRSKPYPYEEALHPTYWTARQAIDFLNSYKDNQPFFLKVSFQAPHPPYDPPKRFVNMYEQADLPKAYLSRWSEQWYGKFTEPQAPQSPRGNLSKDKIRNCRQGYYGAISFVDEQIGRIIDTLKKRGFLENTLILFTSDHGEMAGDHHLWRKTYAYEGSARVPMIIRWPKNMLNAQRGQIFSQPIELRDVLPTFLDAANIPIPNTVEGQSLLNLIRGRTKDWREYIDLEHGTCYFEENVWNALTDGKMKYIYHAYTGQQQLFDLENDPGETNDLAQNPHYSAELQKWRQRLIKHLAVRGEQWVKNGDLVLRRQKIPFGDNYCGKTRRDIKI